MSQGSDALLATAMQQAQQRWPDVSVSAQTFASYVHSRLDDAGTEVDALKLVDLYLACACTSGDARAIAAFEQTYADHISAIIKRVRTTATVHDEASQILRQHLFVADAGRQPKIAAYTGRGDLLAYLRVVAVRTVLQLLRKHKAQRETDDAELMQHAADDDDPELQYLKLLYRKEFKTAFAQTLSELQPRSRTLLRYHLVDRLSIDKIAAIYDIHRSTAARQLTKAREDLITGTQKSLRAQLKVSTDELRSIMRLVQSNVDVSAERLLQTAAKQADQQADQADADNLT